MREKLIELIASKVCDIYSEACEEWIPHDCGKCYANNCLIAEIADHLIANGVTIPVHCKDCKHYDKNALWCNINSAQFSETHYSWYEEDFCSYGERKEK